MATRPDQEARLQLRIADGAAIDDAVAYALSLGMLELIDRFRFRDAADPIPATGAADLPDTIRRHALDGMHAAATCRILVDDLSEGRTDADTAMTALDDAGCRAQQAGFAVHRALRHLAQIGIGVAQHAYEDDDVELIERTMVGVFSHADLREAASTDRIPLVGRTTAELSVELAGLVARLLCEVSPDDPELTFALVADGMDDLHIVVTVDGDVDVAGIGAFPSPVTIVEVTADILRAVTASGVDLTNLRIDWPE